MKFRILYLDRTKDSGLDSYVAEFTKRIRTMGSLEEVWIDASKAAKLPVAERKKAEGELLLRALSAQEYSIALSEDGKTMRSADLAKYLQLVSVRGVSRFAFVVGGAYGLDESIKSGVKDILSLSPLTFTSQLARAVLVEQLYRALTIVNGMPYHKE